MHGLICSPSCILWLWGQSNVVVVFAACNLQIRVHSCSFYAKQCVVLWLHMVIDVANLFPNSIWSSLASALTDSVPSVAPKHLAAGPEKWCLILKQCAGRYKKQLPICKHARGGEKHEKTWSKYATQGNRRQTRQI